jgi:ankyrin repeat protein
MQKIQRSAQKHDPRIYRAAQSEKEACEKVQQFKDKLNWVLKRAAYHNDMLTAKAALDSGADPNSQNILGESPMISLCEKGSPQMLRLFLEYGATLGPDKFGMLPLCRATDNRRLDLIPAMIEAGADINAHENPTMETALHRAVTFRSAAVVEQLLKLGADPREAKAGDLTALDWAREMEADREIVRLLEAAMKKWKDKAAPKKPRRRPKRKLEKMADKYIDNDPGGP